MPRQTQRRAGRSCPMTSRPDPRCQDVLQDVLADPHRSPRKPSVPRVRRLAARTRRILTASWDRNFGIFETKGKRQANTARTLTDLWLVLGWSLADLGLIPARSRRAGPAGFGGFRNL